MTGHLAGTTMQVFNSGKTELTALLMFVVDASKPFSEPAHFSNCNRHDDRKTLGEVATTRPCSAMKRCPKSDHASRALSE